MKKSDFLILLASVVSACTVTAALLFFGAFSLTPIQAFGAYVDHGRVTYGESKTVQMGGNIHDSSDKTLLAGFTYAISQDSLREITFEGFVTARDGRKAAVIGTSDALIGIESGETITLQRTLFRDPSQVGNGNVLIRAVVNVTFLGSPKGSDYEGYFQVEVVPIPKAEKEQIVY